jgi:hypothetical protein
MSTNGDEETNTTEVKTKAPKPAAKSRAKAKGCGKLNVDRLVAER